MIRVLLKQKLDEKSFRMKRRITLSEVAETTGISRATLNRIANVPGYKTNTEIISALCGYFDCLPGELLQLLTEEPEEVEE
ncbi:helix-turn-helix domain-containing protein [Endozoicomonas acroporae]|uniref:helix-turn-helix domain-containing protein n=1 Tax=Endozoicomonas acroporae TaxID=1701104 RepID=UPI003D7A9C90